MPELPEVETTRRGLQPWVEGQRIESVTVRESRLRWPVPDDLPRLLAGQTVQRIWRRAKYLILDFPHGHLIVHLGMSGSLRLAEPDEPLRKHDHVLIRMANGKEVRFHDPRRFGALLWTTEPPERHPLLAEVGPEPLSDAFDTDYLYGKARGRRVAVKLFLMDAKVVPGLGNIYSNESLWEAQIHPKRPAGRIARPRMARLVAAIKTVLQDAIAQGGTTLRDFIHGEGEPGYFAIRLRVYGKEGEPCPRCATPIRRIVLGGRSTYYCPKCQT